MLCDSVTLHLFTKFPSSGFRSKILSGISAFPGICCDLPPSISEKSPILHDLEDESSLLGVPLDQPEHMLKGDLGKLGKHGKEGLPIFADGIFSIRLV